MNIATELFLIAFVTIISIVLISIVFSKIIKKLGESS